MTPAAVFVSPHPDDVALSCGGTVAAHVAAGGRAFIATVFSGIPDATRPLSNFARTLHRRWFGVELDASAAVRARRAEDAAAAAILRAEHRALDHLDAIYRGTSSREELFRTPSSQDDELIQRIAKDLAQIRDETKANRFYLPLGFGLHIDHVLCAKLAPLLEDLGSEVCFFEDFPYALRSTACPVGRSELEPVAVDITAHIDQRLAAIRCYATQLESLFGWDDPTEAVLRFAGTVMADEPCRYGERLWRPRQGKSALRSASPAMAPNANRSSGPF